MAPAYQTPTLASVPITHAPHSAVASGKIIRYALLLEATLNTIGSVLLLYYAEFVAAYMTAPKAPTAMVARLMATANAPVAISPFTVELFAAITAALTVPILLCVPNTKRAVESRPTVYAFLLSAEIALLVLFTHEATTGRNGLHIARCWQSVANFAFFALIRVWVLWIRPELFGSYKEGHAKRA